MAFNPIWVLKSGTKFWGFGAFLAAYMNLILSLNIVMMTYFRKDIR